MNKSDDKIPEHVFLRVSIAGAPCQTIVILLFQNQVPKTCANFVALLSSNSKEATTMTTSRKHPHPTYRGCEFHRIIDKFMVQGGDFERFDGTGGYSPLYKNTTTGKSFDDESFAISHNQAGIVSMANAGPNTNKSQFFITLQSTPHLDKKHVAFGQVVTGMDTVQHMTSVELENNNTNRPVSMQRIVISDCGTGFGKNNDNGDNALSSDDKESIPDRERVKKKNKKKRSSKKSSKKKSKRRYSSSSDDSCDNEERRKKKQHKTQSRDYTSSSSDDEDSRRRRRKKHKKRDGHHHRHCDGSSSSDNDDDDRRKKRKHRSKSSSRH